MTDNRTPPPDGEHLPQVGWWCWRGDNHGHLAATACRSDNVPIHVPTEWADEMRAVIQRIEDGDDEQPAAPAVSSPLPDQTLRDRIASAVRRQAESGNVRYEALADAVMGVLPPPAGRAAVLLEAEQHLRTLADGASRGVWLGMRAAADEMGRLAAEAQQPDTETVPCVRSDAHPPHLHSGLRKGVAVHGRCPGAPAVPVQPAAEAPWPHTMLGAAEVEEKPDLNITPLPAEALVADETVEEPAADGSSEEADRG